jgi:hypothetical protein
VSRLAQVIALMHHAWHSCNVNWCFVAAWDFDMLLDFARVESLRAAHLFIFGVAQCVQ